MHYNWELPDWPDFHYRLDTIEPVLYTFATEAGVIDGMLQALPAYVQQEALLEIILLEAIKTSEIEGEFLSRQDLMSSIRNNLGLNEKQEIILDRKAMGVGQLMVDVRKTYKEPLSCEKLWSWHKTLMSSYNAINKGVWRKGKEPMQVISGAMGKIKIHFQAPPSDQVNAEMEKFVTWFNETAPGGKRELYSAPVRAAIAHLYFESIHPFEDGNGRLGRAIAEKALSQTLNKPIMMSLSRTIEADRKAYYKALGDAQQHNEITDWLTYFVNVVLKAQQEARQTIDFTLKKTIFFDRYMKILNERQLKVVNRIFEAGLDGFKGGMTAKKYMSIVKTSKATATRDLQTLAEMGILTPFGAGRNVHYELQLK